MNELYGNITDIIGHLNEIKRKYNIRESEISLSNVLHPKEVENIGLDRVLDEKYRGYSFNFGMKRENDAVFNSEELFLGTNKTEAIKPKQYVILLRETSSNAPSIGANIQYVVNNAIMFDKKDRESGSEICMNLHNNSYLNNFAFRKTIFDTSFYEGLELCVPLDGKNNIYVTEKEIDYRGNKVERKVSLKDSNKYVGELRWIDIKKLREHEKEIRELAKEINKILFRGKNIVNLVELEKALEKTYNVLAKVSTDSYYLRDLRYILDRIQHLKLDIARIYKNQDGKEFRENLERIIKKIEDFLEDKEYLLWFIVVVLGSLNLYNRFKDSVD